MRIIKVGLFFLLLMFVFLPLEQSYAAEDDSLDYRIETGAFLGETNANNALQQLRSNTGWWATLEPTGEPIPYYQVYSGSFNNEDTVKGVVEQYKNATGFEATYIPLGTPNPLYRIMSGNYYGEENVNSVLQEYKSATGFSARYENVGESVLKKRIFSGAYSGEENVKGIIQEFKNATGLSARYEPTGNYHEAVKIVSGGFYGEGTIKGILQDFTNTTGIGGAYEPIKYEDGYSIISGGFSGEDNVKNIVNQMNAELGINAKYQATGTANIYNIVIEGLRGDSLVKVKTYLNQKKWWYKTVADGTKFATHFRILSEEITDKNSISKAQQYFQAKNWWATTVRTGTKVYAYFNIISDSVFGQQLNNGLKYFTDRKLWVTTQTTNEKAYPYFRLITESLEQEQINQASDFFKNKNLWYRIENTGQTKYSSFQVVTNPLLGSEKSDQALKFFTDNKWWAQSRLTGKNEQSYKVVTGAFNGLENATTNANMVTNTFGWWTKVVKINTVPKIVYTNYNVTLSQMLNMQKTLGTKPQTDKYRNEPAYISNANIGIFDGGSITGETVNLRTTPKLDTSTNISSSVTKGTMFILQDANITGDAFNGNTKWYKIEYNGQVLYVHSALANIGGKVAKTTAQVNILSAQNPTSHIYGTVKSKTILTILELGTNYHRVSYGNWRNAKDEDILQYLDPRNYVNDEKQKFQFLDLSKPSGVSASVLNNFLVNTNTLEGQGQAFVDASKANGVNDIYLISHALLETGYGWSELASGVMYNGVKVYNMFGIGAYDNTAVESGAKRAYDEGWTSPYLAIVGGAKFIGNDYIKGINSYGTVQNTLYKMRWNVYQNGSVINAGHQYASDVGWAYKQIDKMYDLYQQLGITSVNLDIPVYNN